MTDYNGLTGAEENIKGHVGINPCMRKTGDGKPVFLFDISWGVNDISKRRFNTWRHCLAYGNYAEQLKDVKKGDYIKVNGWITSNPVYDNDGELVYVNSKPVTKEYLIITSVLLLEKEKKPAVKQLSLVE